MRAVIGVIAAIVMWIVAKKKGFNPWLWFLAAGIPGFIVLLCMPSAAAQGIDEATSQKRRKTANTVGGILTAIAVVAVVGLILWISSL